MAGRDKSVKGEIAEFRRWLNARDTGDSHHRHLRYRQRTRLYGDYLYFQDRDRFNVEMAQWKEREKKEWT